MQPQDVDDYLQAKFQDEAKFDRVLSAGALVAGLVVLGTSYVLLWSAFGFLLTRVPLGIDGQFWAGVIASLGLLLAFYESGRVHRRLFEPFVGGPRELSLYLLGEGWSPRSAIPFSLANQANSVQFFTDVLYFGPRLLRNSARLLRRSRARADADTWESAKVLSLALAKNTRLTIEEISARTTESNLEIVFEQLGWIDGVIYVGNEPLGIALTDTLKETLLAVTQNPAPVESCDVHARR
ncbi:MAG: hypothetical protein AAF517_10650 [Planctomycetota bacterium]